MKKPAVKRNKPCRKDWSQHLYRYTVKVLEVVDGDSIQIDFDFGYDLNEKEKLIRLFGINTDEMKDKDPAIKLKAQAAKKYLARLCPKGSVLLVVTEYDREEKYGRFMGWIYNDPTLPLIKENSVNMQMVKAGHAREWDGKGPRPTT